MAMFVLQSLAFGPFCMLSFSGGKSVSLREVVAEKKNRSAIRTCVTPKLIYLRTFNKLC